MAIDIDTMVIPNDFPELRLLVWNRDPVCAMTGREAFTLYERNWRYVDVAHLTEAERQLIADLTRIHGRGVLLTP